MTERQGVRGYVPDYPEPSESEMLEAHLRQVGNLRTGDNGIVIQNPINGIRADIAEFNKLGCRVSESSVGYNCTYSVRAEVSIFSNEGSVAGQQHAEAVQLLYNFLSDMQGGSRPAVNRNIFIRVGDIWYIDPL